MLRLSEAFRTNGDFLESVELSLSLRLICGDRNTHTRTQVKVWLNCSSRQWRFCHFGLNAKFCSCESLSYPADVLALRSGGEGLGPDDGVAPHEGDLLAALRAPLFRPNHRAVMEWRQAVHTRLLIDLNEGTTAITRRGFNQQVWVY